MPSWLVRLREIVWSAVFAVVFIVVAVALAVFVPSAGVLAGVLAVSSVALAVISQRA
jgi:hypothetical protein